MLTLVRMNALKTLLLKTMAKSLAIHAPRVSPLSFQDPVKAKRESLVSQYIINLTELSDWCHPMVVVPKNNGGVRITVDLSKLNQQVS